MNYVQLISLLSSIAGSNNIGESWLEGSSSDKETIDVLHSNELGGVGIGDGSSVKDSNGSSGLLGNIGSKPFSDFCMSILSDLWGGSLSGSNGPDWLVGDDDVGPVVALLSDGIQLSIIDILGLSRFSFLEQLSNAGKDSETIVNGQLGLQGHVLVALTVEGSSLGVTSEGGGHSHVFDHANGKLSGIGAISCQGKVLGGHLDVILHNSLNGGQMEGGWGHHHVNLLWIELEVVKNLSWE